MALVLFVSACGASDEGDEPNAQPTPVPGVGGLRWSTPGRWIEREPTGMRTAEYEVPDDTGSTPAVCSVFYFGHGRAGTMEANLERWRAQFELVEHADKVAREVGGLELTVMEVEGDYSPTTSASDDVADALLLGAAISGPQGPVFVKCVGRRAVLEPARAEFVALLASFSPS